MSAAAETIPNSFVDRASDWFNPILVKETRQALKSRQFVATFLLMLLAAWLISIFGVVIMSPGVAYGDVGYMFFIFFYIVLAIAVFLIVPFGAFRGLLSERDQHTWEVLSITTLKPRQIVFGKLLSALVQLFVYYSAITPFIAFANLLKGIDVPTIAFVLVSSMAFSMLLSMAVLTIGTFGTQRYVQVFLTLSVLAGLLFAGMFWSWSILAAAWEELFKFGESEFWWIVAIAASYMVAYSIMFLQIAISQLTFDADNRATGVRLAASGIFWLSVVWVGVALTFPGFWGLPSLTTTMIQTLLRTCSVLGGIHLGVVGLFSATETDALSRRVRRGLARFRMLGPFVAPFLPGGNRGFLFLLVHLGALWLFVAGAATTYSTAATGGTDLATVYAVSAICCYLIIFLGVGAGFGRAIRTISGDFRPAHTRVLTMLLLAGAALVPQTLWFFDSFSKNPRAYYLVTDPFSTVYRLMDGHPDSDGVILLLALAAAGSIFVNLRALLVGVVDAVRKPAFVPATAESKSGSLPSPARA